MTMQGEKMSFERFCTRHIFCSILVFAKKNAPRWTGHRRLSGISEDPCIAHPSTVLHKGKFV